MRKEERMHYSMGSIAEQTGAETNSSQVSNNDSVPSADLLKLVLETLDEAKAEDIVSIDLEGKSSIGDHMIIASGSSTRHVASVSEKLVTKLKESGYGTSRVEGLKSADWVLIDASDIIIHIFRPEVRDFYNLEKIWTHDDMLEENQGSTLS